MTDETKTEAKPADTVERPSTIPPEEMARLTDEIAPTMVNATLKRISLLIQPP